MSHPADLDRRRQSPLALALGALLGGALFLGTGLAVLGTAWGQVTRAIPIEGAITRADAEQVAFAYTTPDGQALSGSEARPLRLNFPAYQPGQKVQILYDPAAPSSSRVNSFWTLWAPPAGLALAGLVLMLWGFRRGRRLARGVMAALQRQDFAGAWAVLQGPPDRPAGADDTAVPLPKAAASPPPALPRMTSSPAASPVSSPGSLAAVLSLPPAASAVGTAVAASPPSTSTASDRPAGLVFIPSTPLAPRASELRQAMGGCVLMGVTAVGLLALATWLATTAQTFLAGAEQTTATVVRVQASEDVRTDSEGQTTRTTLYRHTYTFTNPQGQTFTVTEAASSSAYHPEGSQVVGLYDPKNPEDFRVGGVLSVWQWPVLAGCGGLVFLLFALSTLAPAVFTRLREE